MDENQHMDSNFGEENPTPNQGQQAYTNAQPNQQTQSNYQQPPFQQSNYQQYQQPPFQQPNYQQYQQPPFQQPFNPQVPYGYNQKSKIAAGLLGIFLGCFGVHNFYLGFTGKAVAQLLITVLTCGVGYAISYIWGLIEGIIILTSNYSVDANGVPLSN
ncbi:TM2 domain-containing protein [Paludicola sp. MB14-C6]|uniref:TM2 domain-containing protein n=1 Tax=Paludihabitans sp. MB14-C6 TaxID=3070656 RepID=UPI0027DE1C3F|nr:TM2 domain-containing protein [Paludicola sp. MB14-C6]WMJ24360.1 TM2 domain-containing protein [Paludicola sp. MB14-C6]